MSSADTSQSFSLISNENKTLLKSASHLAYMCSWNSWKNILSVWRMGCLTLDILSNEVFSEKLFDTLTPLSVLYQSYFRINQYSSPFLSPQFNINIIVWVQCFMQKKYFRIFYFQLFSYLVFQLYILRLCMGGDMELSHQNWNYIINSYQSEVYFISTKQALLLR